MLVVSGTVLQDEADCGVLNCTLIKTCYNVDADRYVYETIVCW